MGILTKFRSRIDPGCYPKPTRDGFDVVSRLLPASGLDKTRVNVAWLRERSQCFAPGSAGVGSALNSQPGSDGPGRDASGTPSEAPP